MKKNLCSITISKELKKLKFSEKTRYFYSTAYTLVKSNPNLYIRDWNHYLEYLNWVSIPTVDEAIDWLRKKYNVVIYDHVPPFVDPKDDKHRIMYAYDVKYCNRRDGWNGRVIISHAECCSYDIYAAKRMAIAEAIRWIKKNKKCSKKMKK